LAVIEQPNPLRLGVELTAYCFFGVTSIKGIAKPSPDDALAANTQQNHVFTVVPLGGMPRILPAACLASQIHSTTPP
jgi:hypothetical protein